MSKVVAIARKGRLLHDFPYKSANRSCPHTGIINITKSGQCVFNCAYCYAKGYGWSKQKSTIEVFANAPELLDKELRTAHICPPLFFCAVTDPFQPLPLVCQTSLQAMEVAVRHNVYFKIITKSDYALHILETDWYNCKLYHVSFTCESINQKKLRTISNAPDISRRLHAIEELRSAGVRVTARIDPVLAGFTDDFDELSELVEALSSIGVEHITVSTGTFNLTVLDNLIGSLENSIFSSKASELKARYALYNGRYQMALSERLTFLKEFSALSHRYGMKFSVCMDSESGAQIKNLSPCDPISKLVRRNRTGQFMPVCGADCIHACPDRRSPPCGNPKLMTEFPFKWITLKEQL